MHGASGAPGEKRSPALEQMDPHKYEKLARFPHPYSLGFRA